MSNNAIRPVKNVVSVKRHVPAINALDSHLDTPQPKTARLGSAGGETQTTSQMEEPSGTQANGLEMPIIEGRPRDDGEEPFTLVVSGESQFGGARKNKPSVVQTVTWRPKETSKSLVKFLVTLEHVLETSIKKALDSNPLNRKLFLDVHLEYAKLSGEVLKPEVKAYLRTKTRTVTQGDNFREVAVFLCDKIWERHQNFISERSGLVVYLVHWAKLSTGMLNPLRGSSYVELPQKVRNKRAVINVKNTDNRCFGYALLACKYAQRAYKDRPNEAKQYDKFFADEGLDQITYPVEVTQLENVERSLQTPINVFSFLDENGDGMYPVYLSSMNRKEATNLLYWQGHYSWIKDFPRLMCGVTARQSRKHFCMRCLGHFTCAQVLEKHETICTGDTCQQVMTLMPDGSTLKFRNVRYQQRCPFVVYADFECITSAIRRRTETGDEGENEEDDSTTDPLDMEPETAYQAHKPCSVGLFLLSTLHSTTTTHHYEEHFGEDSASWLLDRLAEIENDCMVTLLDPRRLIMSTEDERQFRDSRECYVCHKPFGEATVKVRDHDHVTGKFRGAAHQSCNLQLRKQYKIPVFFHNFRGYDSHLIVTALGKEKNQDGKKRNLQVIGQGMEKYLTLSYGDHIVIKDSLQFMASSLERLVADLKGETDDRFSILRQEFGTIAEDATKWQLLLRKGVYPYDYVNSFSRFFDKQLPPIEEFQNRLRNEPCKPEDYAHAQTVWREFGCQTFKDYHDLYLKADVLLLADVFEAFRDVCLKNYELDPAYYVSAPHLSWDAMLKSTGCEIDLLSDPEMYRMLEGGLRGGVAMVTKRYAKANNERLGGYDAAVQKSHIMYWDANNLYGWAMSQPLPTGKFRWLVASEIDALDWKTLKKSSTRGFVIECDLDYPDELHDAHNDYPLAPERLKVCGSMLSTKQINLRKAYAKAKKNADDTASAADAEGAFSTKLVPNLYPKTRYCLHYRNLKFYLKHGMVLRKVHRVLEFEQSAWMRSYIEKNQNLRARSTTEFEKNFYKLMNNACYGKTCENQRKRTDIRLLTDTDKAQKILALPHVLSFRVFNSNVAAIELMKPKCIINRPFYVGFTVLELSKLHMYRFHYDFVKKLWPGKQSQLLFTDTDSLMYEIVDDHLYERVWEHREMFDLSEYPEDFFRDNTNKAVVGRFKDEAKGFAVKEFVGLRAKMYSYLVYAPSSKETTALALVEKMRAKGIQKAAIRDMRHADYLAQINNPHQHKLINRRIGSHLHRVFTYEYTKRGLCAFDDKRFILEDGITTLAYGNYRVEISGQKEKHAQNTLAAEPARSSTTTVRTFRDARAAHDLHDHVLEDVEEDTQVPTGRPTPYGAHEAGLRRQQTAIRPGLDPEQVAWQARKARLNNLFGDAEPDDFLDMLPFVA